MSALIIWLAGCRMAKRASHLPPAIDVALDHIIWLRLHDPRLTPRQAGAAVGVVASSWAEVVRAYAAAWERLPEAIKRGGHSTDLSHEGCE